MKIGILTYHDTTNYGAALQAYALQRKIQELGYEVDIIDYKCEAVTNRYKIKKLREIKDPKELIKTILTRKTNRKLKYEFERFKKDFQKISKKCYYKNDIAECLNIYDKIIVGSDQVWNLDLSGNDETYFLDFIKDPKRKIAYAASFGYSQVPQKYVEKTKECLENLDNISVREIQGKKLIEDLVNKQVEVVLDPTLLLEKKDYMNLIEKPKKCYDKDYILLYKMSDTPTLMKFARKLAKMTKCKIIYLNHSYKYQLGMDNVRGASVGEFIWYLENAKYVVTSSFHGVAMSIVFNKNFFYELDNSKGNSNSRTKNLVELLNLESREIVQAENNEIDNQIEYNKVDKILTKEREKSIEFLTKNLESD